ncbi:hypothetical protein [Actinomadura sp. B10D3]|uniref:hypothetical protein n=1 Tax=Actinomadura sp. B10D3 TaxID=3153557 RepID=UPI00325D22AB
MTDLLDHELLAWLMGDWQENGESVCVIQGFSGVGKSRIAMEVARNATVPNAFVAVSPGMAESDEILLDIAAGLEQGGLPAMANEPDLRAGFAAAMKQSCLVVVDDFDVLLDPESRLPDPWLAEFIKQIGRSPLTRGRLLLVSSISLDGDAPWLENARIRQVAKPSVSDAVGYLGMLLADEGLQAEIQPPQRADVVRWLGYNGRAMRILVSCLKDDPLEDLIGLDQASWDMRDQATSPQLIKRLERQFLHRILDRLDPDSGTLLEMLSVYRRPFQKEAIDNLRRLVTNVEVSRERLRSRFILTRNRKWYSLNPVAREILRAQLRGSPKQELAAHSRAADFYVRHFRARSGATLKFAPQFVEARYHLLKSERTREFDEVAHAFRSMVLSAYRSSAKVPEDPGRIEELTATLMAALAEETKVQAPVRIFLAKLLLARGGRDDDRIALQQLTIASRATRDLWAWRTRIQLAGRLEGAAAVEAALMQGVDAVPPAMAYQLYHAAGKALMALGDQARALRLMDKGRSSLPAGNKYGIYSFTAFVLCTAGRQVDALRLLRDGYREIAGVENSERLIEQAIFIAFGRHDPTELDENRKTIMAVNSPLVTEQLLLCEVIRRQILNDFASAAELAQSNPRTHALISQAAFAWLCEREPRRAAEILAQAELPPNKSTFWLRGMVALCTDDDERARKEFSRCLDKPLPDDAETDDRLWLRIWDDIPKAPDKYPAFYFPWLPRALTGLPFDLHRSPDSMPVAELMEEYEIELPLVAPSPPENDGKGTQPGTQQPSLILTVNANAAGGPYMTSNYNNYGLVGAMGENASSHNNTFAGSIAAPGMLAELIKELVALRDAMREQAANAEQDVAVAEVSQAVELLRQGDQEGAQSRLARAGGWALQVATGIGTALAASTLQHVAGM